MTLQKDIDNRKTRDTVTHRIVFAGILPIAFFVLLLGLFIHFGPTSITGFDRTFHLAFENVRTGSSKEEVIALLGPPGEERLEFRLGQEAGYEKQYARARESGSVRYCLWFKGHDTTYAIGFCGDNRVLLKEFGGT